MLKREPPGGVAWLFFDAETFFLGIVASSATWKNGWTENSNPDSDFEAQLQQARL